MLLHPYFFSSDNDLRKRAGKESLKESINHDFMLTINSSEDEDDQVLTFKRKIMPSDDNIEDERTESETEVKVSSSKRHEKHLSKAFVAKKILNKQIQPNTKLYFSEDGEVL